MRRSSVRTLVVVGLVCLTASLVDGCGRRGRLEAPPDPDAAPRDATPSRTGLRKRPPRTQIVPPDEPFVLDPLL